MKPLICLICQTKCFFYQQNIKSVLSKHSRCPVTDFIQIFAQDSGSSKTIEKELQSDLTCVCYECLDKIDVYDLAKSTVVKLEREMQQYFSRGNSVVKTYTGSKLQALNKTDSSKVQQLENTDQNSHEFKFERDDGSEKEDSMNGGDFDDEESSREETNDDIIDMYITDFQVHSIDPFC